MEEREKSKLSLRKDKLENYFQGKRLKIDKHSHNQILSINIEELILTDEIINKKFKNSKEKVLFYKELLSSDNLNNVKYAIFNSNKSLIEENLICEYINEDLINCFFQIFEKYNEISIRYEIISMLFKITNFMISLSKIIYLKSILKSSEDETTRLFMDYF